MTEYENNPIPPQDEDEASMLGSVMTTVKDATDHGSNALKNLHDHKYIRAIIFVVFVFFILRTLGKILDFFSIDSTSVHTYFFWYSILLFFFVILPVKSKTTTN